MQYVVNDIRDLTHEDLFTLYNNSTHIREYIEDNNQVIFEIDIERHRTIIKTSTLNIRTSRSGLIAFSYYKLINVPIKENKYLEFVDDFIIEWINDNNIENIQVKILFQPANKMNYTVQDRLLVSEYFNFYEHSIKNSDVIGLIAIANKFYKESKTKLKPNEKLTNLFGMLECNDQTLKEVFDSVMEKKSIQSEFQLFDNILFKTFNIKNYENHKLLNFIQKLQQVKLI